MDGAGLKGADGAGFGGGGGSGYPYLASGPGRTRRMCASLWPATPSKRQPWTKAPARGCHSSVSPISLWDSGLQGGGDLGAAERSVPQSPPRAAWHLTQRPSLTHSTGGAAWSSQEVGGMRGPRFKSPLHHLLPSDSCKSPSLCFLLCQHRVCRKCDRGTH